MMKGFETYGKWLGTALLAVGLVFAGCVGGSGSDEGELMPSASVEGIPVYVDIPVDGGQPVINFGNRDGFAEVTTANGRSVEISNSLVYNGNSVTTTSDGPGGDGKVWVRVINRDSDEYMANVYVYAHGCAKCSTAQLDSAQLDGTTVVAAVPCVGGCSSPVDIPATTVTKGAESGHLSGAPGMCVVNDGNFRTMLEPHNDKGCKTHKLTNDQPRGQKPFQILHPDCGAIAYQWDFGGQPGQYKFFAALQAEYFPWQDPVGDSRYDLWNYTTYYLMVTNLVDNWDSPPPGLNQNWFFVGTYHRSSVLSGWNAIGDGKANLAPGQLFGVNISVEYADRIESRIVGDAQNFTNYEYYVQWDGILRYDPSAVTFIDGGKLASTPAGTPLAGPGHHYMEDTGIVTQTTMKAQRAGGTLSSLMDPFHNLAEGWIGFSDGYDIVSAWSSIYNVYYETTYGGRGWVPYVIGPGFAGHTGIAHIKVSPYPGYFYATNGMPYSQWIIQEGADPEPDFDVRLYYFQVNNNGTTENGNGSEFWIDTHASASSWIIRWTNGTMTSGGMMDGGMGSDDINHCWKTGAPHLGTCSHADGIIIDGVTELTNPAIKHRCRSCPGYTDAGGTWHFGNIQQWPAHICVQ